ncbi:hypothetical protein QJS10_CPA03g00811 [Acorus calamus]|uniref:Uncharacterized protein n=1 Tax=Acorus calamus TaxID=4465 RepID=A0AAV9F6J8_ACOCL|nr:hypothetical protein QJS10_CPA03g00811 [Acorus calamus]
MGTRLWEIATHNPSPWASWMNESHPLGSLVSMQANWIQIFKSLFSKTRRANFNNEFPVHVCKPAILPNGNHSPKPM